MSKDPRESARQAAGLEREITEEEQILKQPTQFEKVRQTADQISEELHGDAKSVLAGVALGGIRIGAAAIQDLVKDAADKRQTKQRLLSKYAEAVDLQEELTVKDAADKRQAKQHLLSMYAEAVELQEELTEAQAENLADVAASADKGDE